MAEVKFTVPDELIVRQGLCVLEGWYEDGRHFWRIFKLDDEAPWTIEEMLTRAAKKQAELVRRRNQED